MGGSYSKNLRPAKGGLLPPGRGNPSRGNPVQNWNKEAKFCLLAVLYAVLYACTKRKNVAAEHEKLRLISSQEQKIEALAEKLKRCQEEYSALSSKMERAERLHAEQFLAESGSYHDSAATPPLLQSAADAVKDSIAICASDLFAHSKKNSLSLSLAHLGFDQCCGPMPGTIIKTALQSLFCHLLFAGFEEYESFMRVQLPPFKKPKERKRDLFRKYEAYRYLEPQQIMDQEGEFLHFLAAKANLVLAHLEKVLLITDAQKTQEIAPSHFIFNTNNPFHKSFLRLAKAVWILHKLAFSFEPTAEITRIAKGSAFDEEYMESMVQADGSDVEDGNARTHVSFVCVPGFTVRNTIIKSRVFLINVCNV